MREGKALIKAAKSTTTAQCSRLETTFGALLLVELKRATRDESGTRVVQGRCQCQLLLSQVRTFTEPNSRGSTGRQDTLILKVIRNSGCQGLGKAEPFQQRSAVKVEGLEP
mmetsp:Transcript_46110/g.99909  ORF Transcript_46110/g.99909 Transcript_46110/m.99909 type:complete len:111 (-) Transcript_46110:84-416(-)